VAFYNAIIKIQWQKNIQKCLNSIEFCQPSAGMARQETGQIFIGK
jgi:hypothetical protein